MNPGLLLLTALGFPLLLAAALPWLGRRLGSRIGWVALAGAVVACASVLGIAAARFGLEGMTVTRPWAPSWGVNFTFLIDGLSLFFGLVVAGVGVLIVFYAIFYLSNHYAHQGRFYAYLLFFMVSMLGTVFSDNLILLYVFWELTGVASFLLIGFLHETEESRVGARQALLVTVATGLMMLVGLIMLGLFTGKWHISELMAEPPSGASWLTAATVLIVAGAFGKSAQFPMQFWLPNAMAAPTPVSAYLHSATMVKLGVFLSARFFPVLSEVEVWAPLLATAGFVTMLWGALFALMNTDLKAMLAYSTVSQLGLLIGFYGMSAWTGLKLDYLHILSHVFYKGCLFMVAGIVDHAAGTRDIRRLGGLGRLMPVVAIAAAITCAAMAGVPGTIGFLSKETLLAGALEHGQAGHASGWIIVGMTFAAAVLNTILALRFFVGVFGGEMSGEVKAHWHAPSRAIQVPPAILAAGTVIGGILPGVLQWAFDGLRVPGLQAETVEKLKLWHGLTGELGISAAVLVAGFVLWRQAERRGWFVSLPTVARFDLVFEAGLRGLLNLSRSVTRWTAADRPTSYLPIIMGAAVVMCGGYVWSAGGRFLDGGGESWSEVARFSFPRTFVAILICVAIIGVVVLKRWTTQLIALSVSGFLTTFYFVLYRAPDLALTQILIESASLILILLLLARFPRSAELGEQEHRPAGWRKGLMILISAGTGIMMTTYVLVMTAEPSRRPMGQYFLENTDALAGGSNAVNTILVDFRGFDTLGEITVLVIATLGCMGLLMRYRRPGGRGGRRAERLKSAGGQTHPEIEGARP